MALLRSFQTSSGLFSGRFLSSGGLLLGASLSLLTACTAQGQQAEQKEKRRKGEKETGAIASSLIPHPSPLNIPLPHPERRAFWSFQPVKNPKLPTVKNLAWCKNPIDRFILAGLEAKGLKPAPAADRRTLIRRASFDLTGLPPTPEDVEAFVNDKSPNAWEKVIDRLLASPAYGERWGRHWLDVVRYADSLDARGVGSEGDISEAWRYRDWVINAFNTDLPYNWFMKYQVAGDLIPEGAVEEKEKRRKEEEKTGAVSLNSQLSTLNSDGIVATGLLAIGNWGNGDADKDKILTDIADDQVDVISRGMMGLTVACARCHDHKFDPISTKDYYGLAGIFFSTHILPKLTPKGAGENILRVSLDTPEAKARREQYAKEMTEGAAQIQREREKILSAYAKSLLPQTARYVQAAWQYAHRPTAQAAQPLEAFAAAQNLQPWALKQWNDYLKPGGYTLMLHPQNEVSGMKGVSAWRGPADCPNLLVNANDTPRTFSTLTLPPRSVCVHPGPTNGVVVAWQSPMTGTVRITGRVTDADPNGGDGIAWAIDQRSAGGARELATGEFPNGGAQDFAQGHIANPLQTVSVRQGDRIELHVLPKENYGYDTTVVDLTITEVDNKNATAAKSAINPGENVLFAASIAADNKNNFPLPKLGEGPGVRAWNLAHDLLPDPLNGGKGNPHSDSYGNAGVWRFEDMADRHRSATPDAVFNPHLAQVQQFISDGSGSASAIPATVQQTIETFARSFTNTDAGSPFSIRNASEENLLPVASRTALAALQAKLDALRKNAPPMPGFANGAQEGGVPESPHAGVHDVRVHIRGNYARLGDLVPRHFPVVLAGENQTPITQGSGRLQLAEWLASDTHPLTGRVWVNRVWQHHFGQGIVRTPSNFGFLGEKPTHPELLDWLASHFVEGSGVKSQGAGKFSQSTSPDSWPLTPDSFACSWSTKKLHKLILMSATYQQASEGRAETVKADPDNRLVGRMSRLRLEAEAVRDSLLAASGKLDATMGGVAYRDFAIPRRTLYYMTIRSDRAGFGTLFDGADSTACVEKRTVSTVAPQSLYLLNNPFVLDQTRAFAQRLAKEVPEGANSDPNRIRRAYLLLYARPATAQEIGIARTFLQRVRNSTKDNKDAAAWEQYCHILLCANEFVYVD